MPANTATSGARIKTLARLGEGLCQTPKHFKAWSQNLGHEHVLTTFQSYGVVARPRQGEIIRGLAMPRKAGESYVHELAEELIRKVRATPYTSYRD